MRAKSERNGAALLVTGAKSYLCESVLVQKTLAELGAQAGSGGCSQCAPAMGVTERPVSVTSQGGVSAEATRELPPCGRSIGLSPQALSAEIGYAVTGSGYFGA